VRVSGLLLREWVAQSGKKREDFVQEHQARQAQQAVLAEAWQLASAPADTDTNKDKHTETKAATEQRVSSGTAPP
jgi:hypothetical protein